MCGVGYLELEECPLYFKLRAKSVIRGTSLPISGLLCVS